MVWNGHPKAFIDWFVSPTTGDDELLKQSLTSIPDNDWDNCVYAKLLKLLDEEKQRHTTEAQDAIELKSLTQQDHDDYDLAERKEGFVNGEMARRHPHQP